MGFGSNTDGRPIQTVSSKTSLCNGSRVQPIPTKGWGEEGGGKDGNGGKKGRCCGMSTIILILLVVVLTIGLIFVVANFYLTENETSGLCSSRECIDAAGEMMSFMDQTVDPCDNFVEFSCGGWKSKHPVPMGHGEEDIFSISHERNLYKVKKLLEVENYSEKMPDPSSVKKMKRFYSACMNDLVWATAGVSPLVSAVEKIGGFPMANSSWNGEVHWLDRITQIKKLYSANILMKIKVAYDAKNSSNYAIHIGAGMLPGLREYIIRDDSSTRRLQLDRIVKIAEYFNADFLKQSGLKSKKVFEKVLLEQNELSLPVLKIDQNSLQNITSIDLPLLKKEQIFQLMENLIKDSPETLELKRQKYVVPLSNNALINLNIAQSKHDRKSNRIGKKDVLDGVVSSTEDIAGIIRFQQSEGLSQNLENSTEFNETEENIEPEIPNAVEEVYDLYAFIVAMARISTPSEDLLDQNKLYNPMTINTLQIMSDALGEESVKINWLDHINNVFSDVDIEMNGNTRVIVTEPTYLFTLLLVMNRVPERTIANYMAYMLTLYIEDEVFKPGQRPTRYYKERWLKCTEKTTQLFDEAVSYLYIRDNLNTSSVDSAREMVSDVQGAFREILSENNWMDQETKSSAIHKLDSIINLIGYEFISSDKNAEKIIEKSYAQLPEMSRYDHFGNMLKLSVFHSRKGLALLNQTPNRQGFFVSASEVNAYYSFSQNAIVIPAGILQAPFFRQNTVQALNYGGVGVVIGHEITHGFDDAGREIDSLGNLRNWWSSASLLTFAKKAKCFVEQYGRFPLPNHFDDIETAAAVDSTKLDGKFTLGENIADNAGVRAAFKGFQNRLHKSSDEPQTLPGLEHFTPEQLFFISYSQVWCKNYTPKGLRSALVGEFHSPGPFRVRGVFENNEDMRNAFKCTRRVEDNFNKVCKLW